MLRRSRSKASTSLVPRIIGRAAVQFGLFAGGTLLLAACSSSGLDGHEDASDDAEIASTADPLYSGVVNVCYQLPADMWLVPDDPTTTSDERAADRQRRV